VRQLFLRMFFHEVRLRFRVLRIFCSTLLVRYTLFRVYLCGSRFRSSKDPLRCLQMKGAILFCDYLLLQRAWLLGLFSPRATNLFIGVRASLEVWFPSVVGVSGACFSQVFTAWHCPLLRFLIASVVCSSSYLSGLFHPETLLGFPFRAFSFKRLVSSF